LWDAAILREERYAALGLLGYRGCATIQTTCARSCVLEPRRRSLASTLGLHLPGRLHARADPDAMRQYVAEHAAELSGLSRREAMKHLSP
jgi:hypothetical protein